MAVSYGSMVWGTAKLNPSVDIQSGVNDTFTFSVDATEYTIYISTGVYTTVKEQFTSQLVAQVNTQLSAVSCPVTARLGGVVALEGTNAERHTDVLIFEHNDKTAAHTIDGFTGTANATIFGGILRSSGPISY